MYTYGNGLNITENSAVPAQTPPFKGGVLAWTALFSLATVVAYGGERVNQTESASFTFEFDFLALWESSLSQFKLKNTKQHPGHDGEVRWHKRSPTMTVWNTTTKVEQVT